jgi:hypothetical protein
MTAEQIISFLKHIYVCSPNNARVRREIREFVAQMGGNIPE